MNMKCKNCNATMEIDPSKQEAVCPYCGAKELICDSDAVAVEKIKSSTFKEMEYAHMENQRRQQDHIEKERERKAYINGAFSKFTIAFIFACLIAVFVSFSDKYILSGIIAITQTVLFAVSWLIGMQLLKHNKKSLYRALAVLGLILIIPFFASTQIKLPEKLNWPSSGLAKNLPDPPAKYGTITADNNDLFDVDFEKMTADDYRNYINDCKDKGFTIDPDESGSSYSAYNDDGFKLVIDYSDYNNEMAVSLDAPEETTEFTWPETDLSKLIPQPKSNFGNINFEHDDSISIDIGKTSESDYAEYVQTCIDSGFNVDYKKSDKFYNADDSYGNHLSLSYKGNQIMNINLQVANSEAATDSDNTNTLDSSETTDSNTSDIERSSDIDSSSVTSELKDFLDSYEAFADEYIAFMQKYNESDDTLSMLSDYNNMLSRYADFSQKIDSYNTDEMSAADAAYFLEVTSRIDQKLINASLS